jgi:hypothetical protein
MLCPTPPRIPERSPFNNKLVALRLKVFVKYHGQLHGSDAGGLMAAPGAKLPENTLAPVCSAFGSALQGPKKKGLPQAFMWKGIGLRNPEYDAVPIPK